MPTYTFTVELKGSGQTPEEAWEDAIDSFAVEPGEPLEIFQDDEDFTDLPEDADTDSLFVADPY